MTTPALARHAGWCPDGNCDGACLSMPAVLVTNHQPAAPTERFRLGRNDGLYPNDTRPFSNFVGVALLADGPDTHVVLCTGDRVEDGPTQTKQLTPAEAQEYAEAILRHVQRARVEDSTTVVTP